jgi:ribonuclease P protein subunit RPR2
MARVRIATLFDQVAGMKPFNQALADRYVAMVWTLATKNNIRLPIELKRSFCRKCKSYWLPGKTVRIRIHQGKKIYTCLVCKAIKRVPIK